MTQLSVVDDAMFDPMVLGDQMRNKRLLYFCFVLFTLFRTPYV